MKKGMKKGMEKGVISSAHKMLEAGTTREEVARIRGISMESLLQQRIPLPVSLLPAFSARAAVCFFPLF